MMRQNPETDTSEKLVFGTIFKRIYAVLRTFDVFDLVLIARISPNSNHHLKAMVLLYHFLAYCVAIGVDLPIRFRVQSRGFCVIFKG